MASWYLARIELHEKKQANGQIIKPTEKDYDKLHKAMRKPGFSRMVKVSGGLKRLPDATYDKEASDKDTEASVDASVVAAVDSVWMPNSYILVKYEGKDFTGGGLLAAPQSLIDFEKQNSAGS